MLEGFQSVPLLATQEVAELQTLLTLPLTEAGRAAWTTPGQYVKLTTDDDTKPGFFVIANAPGNDTLEVLIKEASPLTATLRTLAVGTELQITPPQGKGFPLEASAGKDVLLMAAGSGIAALRPIIQQLLRHRDACGAIHLLYGERTPQRLAFQDDVAAWAAAGITTHVCLSAAPQGDAGIHAGYVQDVLRQLQPNPATTVGYLSGMEAMLVACRAAYAELGGDPATLYTNF